jgi:hypothetical protein
MMRFMSASMLSDKTVYLRDLGDPFASRLAPTFDRGKSQISLTQETNCGSEPAREDGLAVTPVFPARRQQ